jgi:hypothetical protein
MDMPYLLTLLILTFSFTASAKIYTWQDAQGVTHFAEEKPDHQAKVITPTPPVRKKLSLEKKELAETITLEPQTMPSNTDLVGKWTGFSNTSKSTQEWIFDEQGLFTIKQSSTNNLELVYTGKWELAKKAISFDGRLTPTSNLKDSSTDMNSVQQQAEIFKNENNRLLISFNDEKFWIERHRLDSNKL